MSANRMWKRKRILQATGSYLLAGITGALGIINWFVFRDVMLTFLMNSEITPWAWQAIDLFSFVLFGIGWLVVVLFCQHYYKKGFEHRNVLQRFSWVTSLQLFVLVLCQIYILYMTLGYIDLFGALLIFMQCFIGVGLMIYALWKRHSPF